LVKVPVAVVGAVGEVVVVDVLREASRVAVEIPSTVVQTREVARVVTKAVQGAKSRTATITSAMISHVVLASALTASSSTRYGTVHVKQGGT
jgi:hypothetical protein